MKWIRIGFGICCFLLGAGTSYAQFEKGALQTAQVVVGAERQIVKQFVDNGSRVIQKYPGKFFPQFPKLPGVKPISPATSPIADPTTREQTAYVSEFPSPASKRIQAREIPAPSELVPNSQDEEPSEVIRFFHRLGNEGGTVGPRALGDPYRRAADSSWKPKLRKSSTEPFELLVLRAQEEGILPHNWNSMSRSELESWITTVHQAQASSKQKTVADLVNQYFPSANEVLPGKLAPLTVQELRQKARQIEGQSNLPEDFVGRSVSLETENWARTQPDFIEENFVYDPYTEPWNENVSQLRILMVNDLPRLMEPFKELAARDPRIVLDTALGGEEAILKLQQNPGKYDIVMTDYHMPQGLGTIISMYVRERYFMELKANIPPKEQQYNFPVVVLAYANGMPSWWFKYGMCGRIEIGQGPQAAFNFASNIVATGRAFPGKQLGFEL